MSVYQRAQPNKIRKPFSLRQLVRLAAKEEKKSRQGKSKPASLTERADGAIQNSKKPRNNSQEVKAQKSGTAGETIPIVFGKRANNIGGVWLEPVLAKQASYGYQGIFLYPLSQGEIVSTPSAFQTYVGSDQIQSRTGTLPVLNKYYASASAMASSPNVCPITSGKIFCDPNTNWFFGEVRKAGSFTILGREFSTYHTDNAFLTIGSGDTTNAVFVATGDNFLAWDSVTGADLTAAYFSNVGITNRASYEFVFNRNPRGGTLIGGFPVGHVDRGIVNNGGALGELFPLGSNAIAYAFYGTSNVVNQRFENTTVNNQYKTTIAATTGTLGGVVSEFATSTIQVPTSPGSSFDFTDYADITWLEIQGNIYDESNPLNGEYKITTRQLATLITDGVKVSLYSAGTPNTTGASNQFVDLAMHLFALIGRVDGSNTASIASPIDTSNLQALAAFNTNIGAFFNGVIEQSVNIIDYISAIAPFYLLQFVSENGRYAFKSLVPITAGNQINGAALTPSATFTEANIIPGSFQKQYDPAESRRDVQLSIAFRDSSGDRVGLQKNRFVRFSTVSNSAPVEQFDMTDGCTSKAHADLFAKYELAKRKHSTHTIVFDTPLLTNGLSIFDVIKVQRQRINSVGDDRTETDHYQVTAINHDPAGVTSITAIRFPLNASNISLINNEILNGSFTTI